MLMYDWVLYRLTVRVGNNTPIFSETSEDLFEVFKSIVDEFSSDEEENLEPYTEKGKHFFYREEMHDVLYCDRCSMVRVAPSLRHSLALTLPHQEVRSLIALCFDMVCGSKDGDASSSSSPIGSGSNSE
jgi:hypothetical protein